MLSIYLLNLRNIHFIRNLSSEEMSSLLCKCQDFFFYIANIDFKVVFLEDLLQVLRILN